MVRLLQGIIPLFLSVYLERLALRRDTDMCLCFLFICGTYTVGVSYFIVCVTKLFIAAVLECLQDVKPLPDLS